MSNSLTAKVLEAFSAVSSGITLIITVGNSLRSDDGIGPYIAQKCTNLKKGIELLDAADKPENIIDKAAKLGPVKVVIIDAADFGAEEGKAQIIEAKCIPETTLSTHTFPLRIVAKILEEDCGAPVTFVGIQPKNVGLGEGLSEKVKKTADEMVKLLSAQSGGLRHA
ncbi:MAG: hydrogenase maturation peptidase HycI [Candidatus Saganbacteria bacterium]|nr:hydrogenase maturation peptidase HycI [Candidatus Saganbacteria bacterium]